MLSRTQLRDRLVSSFASQAEVFDISFFGSEADGCADAYSDIDIIICSADLETTQSNYRKTIAGISPIIGSLLLESHENHLVEMIALASASPYHKLDIHFTDNIERINRCSNFYNVFKRSELDSYPESQFTLVPHKQDAAWVLNDILFSVPRFTKCLFRGDFDYYRRWHGVLANLWTLVWEKYFGWRKLKAAKPLSPLQAKQLYKILSDEDLTRLYGILPVTTCIDIPSSFLHGLEMFVDLSRDKAQYFQTEINLVFADHMTNFLRLEIKRYGSEKQRRQCADCCMLGKRIPPSA